MPTGRRTLIDQAIRRGLRLGVALPPCVAHGRIVRTMRVDAREITELAAPAPP